MSGPLRVLLHMAHTGEFDTIESAIEEIRAGRVVIVVDDEDRENEGDFLTAAHNATPGSGELHGHPWPWAHLCFAHRAAMRRTGP